MKLSCQGLQDFTKTIGLEKVYCSRKQVIIIYNIIAALHYHFKTFITVELSFLILFQANGNNTGIQKIYTGVTHH